MINKEKVINPNKWEAADRAYQDHHINCQQCISAGARPGRAARCMAGLRLWNLYLRAGPPPHFTWIDQKKDKS